MQSIAAVRRDVVLSGNRLMAWTSYKIGNTVSTRVNGWHATNYSTPRDPARFLCDRGIRPRSTKREGPLGLFTPHGVQPRRSANNGHACSPSPHSAPTPHRLETNARARQHTGLLDESGRVIHLTSASQLVSCGRGRFPQPWAGRRCATNARGRGASLRRGLLHPRPRPPGRGPTAVGRLLTRRAHVSNSRWRTRRRDRTDSSQRGSPRCWTPGRCSGWHRIWRRTAYPSGVAPKAHRSTRPRRRAGTG